MWAWDREAVQVTLKQILSQPLSPMTLSSGWPYWRPGKGQREHSKVLYQKLRSQTMHLIKPRPLPTPKGAPGTWGCKT